MRGFNFDISSLFSNLGSGSSFSSFNFSDYASIKNGSYGKLIKQYYAEQKKASVDDKTSSSTSRTKEKKTDTIDNAPLAQLKKEADGLKSAAEALNKDELWKQTNGEYDMDKIVSAVKSFANEYNDTISQSSKVSSKDIGQYVRYMSSMTNTMSKALSKVGITVGTDGKISIDEDKLKKSDVSSLKSLFTGSTSYGSQIIDKASEISKDAIMSSGVYGSNGALSHSISSMFNKWI